MRTLRLWLAGVVILVLLGGLGGAVMAQSSEPEVAAGSAHEWVTPVSRTCSDPDQSVNTGSGGGFVWFRDWTYRCQENLSDPRVTGALTGHYNDDCWGDGYCIYWGTEELVGPDGTWTGAYHGTTQPGNVQTSYKVMTGSGDYEGLTFIWHGTGTQGSVDGHGLIYEGATPPMPVPEPLPAE